MSKKLFNLFFTTIVILIFVTKIESISLLNSYQRLIEKHQQLYLAQKRENEQNKAIVQTNKNGRLNLKIYRLSPSEIEEAISQQSNENNDNTELFYDESGGVYHVPKGRLQISEIVGSSSRNILIQ